jgi:hypothetical protein
MTIESTAFIAQNLTWWRATNELSADDVEFYRARPLFGVEINVASMKGKFPPIMIAKADSLKEWKTIPQAPDRLAEVRNAA